MTESERKWLTEQFFEVREEITKLRIAAATQNVKSHIISILAGTLGGIIPVLVAIGLIILKVIVTKGSTP